LAAYVIVALYAFFGATAGSLVEESSGKA